MDDRFEAISPIVQNKIEGVPMRLLHAPFNELFPCAIDPMARELARLRYIQAIELSIRYGAHKLIIHGGYNPKIYFPIWYIQQSIEFWQEFIDTIPDGITVCLENVLEETPDMLLAIVKNISSPKLRLCLDIGHVNAYSNIPIREWMRIYADYLSHFHIHNNDGDHDSHSGLPNGSISMHNFLGEADALLPAASYTLEIPDAEPSILWLNELISDD